MEFKLISLFLFLSIFNLNEAANYSVDPVIEIWAKSQALPGGKVSYKLLHKGNNADAIILPLYYSSESNQWVEKPIENVTTPAILQFDCTASYAVEFVYEGDGLTDDTGKVDYPFNFKHSRLTATRNVKEGKFWEDDTYTFKVQISDVYIREKLTGNYSCRSIERNNVLAWTYVFAPENAVTSSIAEEARRILLRNSNHILIAPENSTSLVLPCSVSHPDAKVTLFKVSGMGDFQKVFLETSQLHFEPRKGFILENLNFTYLLGTYMCRAENFKSFQIFVYPPKDFVVSISPNDEYVPIIDGEEQIFECNAKQNITLHFSEENYLPYIQYKFSRKSEFPFTAIASVNPADILRFTRINCTTLDSNEVLHIWEYSTYKNEVELHHDETSHQILCCADSHNLPKFKALQCHSEMECDLKRNFMFNVAQYEYEGDSFEPLRCVSLRWVIYEGKLECSIDFKTISTHLTNFNGFTSVDDEITPTPENLITIQHDIPYIKDRPRDILLGETFSFFCEASPKYFATGSPYVKFGLERENGSIEILEAPHCRLNACGPISGIQFNDIGVRKVFCFAPLYDSSTEWRNTSLSIRVTDNPPTKIRAVLADKVDDGVSFPLMSIPNTDIILRETAMFQNRKLRLECESSFEISWEYKGSGTPVVKGKSNVAEREASDLKAYVYQSSVEFTRVDEMISGKYSCVVKNKPKLSSYFRIFVPGSNAFLDWRDKTVTVSPVDLEFHDYNVTIPCPISDSAQNVMLLTETASLANQWVVATPDDYINFDPLMGFEIQTKNYESPWIGSYICKTESGYTSGTIKIVFTGDSQFKVTPNSIYANNDIREGKPTVKCEAKEEVTLNFPGILEQRHILQEIDFDSEYPYSATYFHSDEYIDDRALIECATVENSTILHTWSHMPKNFYKPPLTYYYDQNKVRYVCCTNSNVPAVLKYVPCSESSECNIRKSCLAHENCSPLSESEISHEDLPDDCVGFKIEYYNEGLLRCSVSGIYQEYIYTDFFYAYRNESEKGKLDVSEPLDNLIPSQRFETKKQEEKKPGIIQTPEYDIVVGDTVRFDCYAPKCVEKGIQWALFIRNGSIVYIDGFDDYTNIEADTHHGWTIVTFEDYEVAAVRCIPRNILCSQLWTGVLKTIKFHKAASTPVDVKSSSLESRESLLGNSTEDIAL